MWSTSLRSTQRCECSTIANKLIHCTATVIFETLGYKLESSDIEQYPSWRWRLETKIKTARMLSSSLTPERATRKVQLVVHTWGPRKCSAKTHWLPPWRGTPKKKKPCQWLVDKRTAYSTLPTQEPVTTIQRQTSKKESEVWKIIWHVALTWATTTG